MAYVQLAFLSLLWGFSFLLIKIAAQAFDWIGYACGRAGVAALALAAVALARRAAWPRSAKVWRQMAAMSLTGQVGPFLLFGVAAHLITSADMALMMGSAPIFTFVLARMFGLGEVWNARAAAGLALGLVGVALSLGSPFAGGGAAHAGLGRALALVGALGYAGSALLSRPVSRAVGAAMAATGSMAISGALLARGRTRRRRARRRLRIWRRSRRGRSPRSSRSACSTPASPISSISA